MHRDVPEPGSAQVVRNFVAIAPIARDRTPLHAAHP
jgi:hypothetical protein